MILRQLTATLLVLTASAGLAGANDALMSRYGPEKFGYTSEKFKLPVVLKWEHISAPYSGNPASALVEGNTVFFVSDDRAYAVDLDTGELAWKYPSDKGLGSAVRGTPALYKGNFYFGGGDGVLYCLDATTGGLRWRHASTGPIRSSPIVADGIVYFGSDDDSARAVDALTGRAVWARPFVGRDDMSGGIAVGGGMAFFACTDGNLYALAASTGQLRWNFRLASTPVRITPILLDNMVIMPVGNTINVLSAKSGQFRFSVPVGTEIPVNLAVSGQDVFAAGRDGKLYAYTWSGRQFILKWKTPVDMGSRPMADPIIAGDSIYVVTGNGTLQAYSTKDGTLLWRYVLTSKVTEYGVETARCYAAPTVANGSLLVLSDDGVLRCFTQDWPDIYPPKAFNFSPIDGQKVPAAPPLVITGALFDAESGVDFSSVRITLDGNPLEVETNFGTSIVKAMTEVPEEGEASAKLESGPHKLALSAKDYSGNIYNLEWSVMADPSLEPPKITKTKKKTEETPTVTPEVPVPAVPEMREPGAPPPPPPPPPPPAPGAAHGAGDDGAPPPPVPTPAEPGTGTTPTPGHGDSGGGDEPPVIVVPE